MTSSGRTSAVSLSLIVSMQRHDFAERRRRGQTAHSMLEAPTARFEARRRCDRMGSANGFEPRHRLDFFGQRRELRRQPLEIRVGRGCGLAFVLLDELVALAEAPDRIAL